MLNALTHLAGVFPYPRRLMFLLSTNFGTIGGKNGPPNRTSYISEQQFRAGCARIVPEKLS